MVDNDTRKLFVAGLSDTVSEGDLRKLFEEAGGSVTECAVPRDRQTGRGRGFGFVTLSSDEEANRTREALDGSLLEGRPMSVRPFRGNRNQSRPPRPPGPGGGPPPSSRDREDRESTLFLAGLPGDCTEEEINDVFAQAGVSPLLRLHLPVDPEGRRRGFGFASLKDADAAREAVPKLRECTLRGRPVTVDVARPRGERPERSGPPNSERGSGGWRPRGGPPSGRRDSYDSGAGTGGPPPSRSSYSDMGGVPGGAPTERQTWDERRGGPGSRKQKAPKKKKDRGSSSSGDRARSRRDSEGFRAPRARGIMDDWDED